MPEVVAGFDATAETDVLPADQAPAWDRLTKRADEFDAGEIAGTGFDGGADFEPIDAAARLAAIGAAPVADPSVTSAESTTSDVVEAPDERAAAAAEQTSDLHSRETRKLSKSP